MISNVSVSSGSSPINTTLESYCVRYYSISVHNQESKQMEDKLNETEVMNLTSLRKNIYSVFDGVIETGKPVVVERNGVTLTVSLANKGSKMDRLERMGERSCIVGSEEGLESESVFEWEPDNGFD